MKLDINLIIIVYCTLLTTWSFITENRRWAKILQGFTVAILLIIIYLYIKL